MRIVKMNQETLLRLAISLDDRSAETVEKYICKLVENILFFDKTKALRATDIVKILEDDYGLQFSALEIENAIQKKSRQDITKSGNVYQLSVRKENALRSLDNPQNILMSYINQYVKQLEDTINPTDLFDLIIRYIYYCFNSSYSNFLYIIQSRAESVAGFEATNEEIALINGFLIWDSADKDAFLYSIITISYEYCMLTVKKDTLLSKKIFKGKRFVLDANIIFRLAGINNEERKAVTKTFVDKCREVGIELCYTTDTLNEIYRVIEKQIMFIRTLTLGQQPIDNYYVNKLNHGYEQNPFYIMYYNWSCEKQNDYKDFITFQRYLQRLIREVLTDLNAIDVSGVFFSSHREEYSSRCVSLQSYKQQKKPNKSVPDEAIKTDINNIYYVLSQRNKDNKNLWQTKEFLVTADQILTQWAKNEFSGVPLVVIPSVWLSIILRFSGRSSEDYSAYCQFLTLRQHYTDDVKIKPEWLLPILGEYTVDKKIKEQIIDELITNESDYDFQTESSGKESVRRAFDKLVIEIETDHSQQLEAERQKHLEDKSLSDEAAREQTIINLATKMAEKNTKKYIKIAELRFIIWGASIIIFIILVLKLLIAGEEWAPANSFSIILTMFVGFSGEFLKQLGSDKRKKSLIEKYYKKYRELDNR